MSPLTIIAPTDAQLLYIADLCDRNGCERPPAVYSKTEASEIIEAILRGQYDPDFYRPGAHTYYGLDADDEDVPF